MRVLLSPGLRLSQPCRRDFHATFDRMFDTMTNTRVLGPFLFFLLFRRPSFPHLS